MVNIFNEDNVTEKLCIEAAIKAGYEYKEADALRIDKSTVVVENLLREALIRINNITEEQAQFLVENIVNDIDQQVVDIIRRFTNAFHVVSGQQEVRKTLRSILWLKYKIKDQDVFEKAYKYVEMYY